MATVKIPLQVIEYYITQHNAIMVTNFSWSNSGYNSTPEIEWELDDIVDLEYENDNYVEIEEYNKIKDECSELQLSVESLERQVDELETTLSTITAQLQHEQARNKSFWKFW